MKKLILLTIMMTLVSSCASQKFYISEEPLAPGLVPTQEGSAHFFITGIGQTREINARQICNDRPIRILETRYSFADGFIGLVTMGLYTPRSWAVYCGVKAEKPHENEKAAVPAGK
jgi:hypothetical protein